jgi:hypothetical protein
LQSKIPEERTINSGKMDRGRLSGMKSLSIVPHRMQEIFPRWGRDGNQQVTGPSVQTAVLRTKQT